MAAAAPPSTSPSPPHPAWSLLPLDVLGLIFEYSPLLRRRHVLSRVSKRFRCAALHTMRTVTVRQPRHIDDRIAWKADEITALFPSLTELTLVICRPLFLSVNLPTSLRSLHLSDDSSDWATFGINKAAPLTCLTHLSYCAGAAATDASICASSNAHHSSVFASLLVPSLGSLTSVHIGAIELPKGFTFYAMHLVDLALHTGALSPSQCSVRLSILLQFTSQLTSLTVSRDCHSKGHLCALTSVLTTLHLPRVTALTLLHLPLLNMLRSTAVATSAVSRVHSLLACGCAYVETATHLLALREVSSFVLKSLGDKHFLDLFRTRNASIDSLTSDRSVYTVVKEFTSIRELNLLGHTVLPMKMPKTPLANMRRITVTDYCINCNDFVTFFRDCCNVCFNLEIISVDSLATLSRTDLRRLGKQLKRRTSISFMRIVTSYKASVWALARRLERRRCARIVLEARPDSDADSDESSGL